MPSPGPADHVLGYLYEIGPVAHGGMGPAPIGHAEIEAWQGNTGIELTAWEARTLRRLSLDYIAASRQAEEPGCQPPWDDRPPQERREKISRAIDVAFSSMASPEQRRRARKVN